ncbi:sugar ABC transporter substrate-binding protein [uncultured Arthrobacter sp.]|uniref:sugar ABC transporter substrate-binding protein n=1 Tax=uncultured Arthrobacter sp. TaxID=114050 RepID=UPI0025DA5CB0|nr:sugar ABC transporter substrate-binding protein [uncultured Arthrobacter sp.]
MSVSMRRVGIVVLLAMAVLGVAACGGGSGGGDSGGGSGTVPAAVSQRVENAKSPVKNWPGPTESIKAPTSKKIVAITCSSQGYGCVQGGIGVQQAGEALGWDVTVVDGKGDPGVWNSSIQQAIVTKADGIVLLAINPQLVQGALDKAKTADIPVISTFIPKLPGPTVDGYVSTDHVEGGKILADWIIEDSGGDASVLMLNEKAFPELVQRNEALVKELKDQCPNCEVADTVQLSIGTMGQELAPAVTSALQRNPNITHVVAPFDSSGILAGQGIRQAGKTGQVKLVSAEGDPNGIRAVQSGEQAVDLATVPPWGGWAASDLLARQFAGEPVDSEVLPQRLFDESNVPSGEGWDGDVDYEAEFKKLWGR